MPGVVAVGFKALGVQQRAITGCVAAFVNIDDMGSNIIFRVIKSHFGQFAVKIIGQLVGSEQDSPIKNASTRTPACIPFPIVIIQPFLDGQFRTLVVIVHVRAAQALEAFAVEGHLTTFAIDDIGIKIGVLGEG